MKLQALLIALALAAGTAFAQAPNGTAKAPADSGASAGANVKAGGTTETKKVQKKKVKAKKGDAHKHHQHHSSMRGQSTRSMGAGGMGAGALSPVTDLDARARQQRIDQAYENWLRLQSRR